MKSKSKKATIKKKKEFRFHKENVVNKNGKQKKLLHPAYVFLEKGNLYIYVSITHSSEIGGLKVIKLSKNPKKSDKSSIVQDGGQDRKAIPEYDSSE